MIGFGEGGSGGGSIEPGDTAADYDSIRNYTGTATVRDVVGQRIAGRFVVNPDDTTSGEIPGGILVDVLGRRWYRRAEFVSYDMFMAPVFRVLRSLLCRSPRRWATVHPR